MKLLVSVAGADEASEALSGGADIVDAKDPFTGSLGAVDLDTFTAIVERCHGAAPVSAALGDAGDETTVERDTRAYACAGATFVKLGFNGICDGARIEALIAAAMRGTRSGTCRVVAAAYADADPARTANRDVILGAAARQRAAGVLLDTCDKLGPGLLELISPDALGRWVAEAHLAGLLVAVAGRLSAADLPIVAAAGADIAGVRGAACEGGRGGAVTANRVQVLRRPR
jgi:(5-formylfuran-3-yl)methyl phosphate synthase